MNEPMTPEEQQQAKELIGFDIPGCTEVIRTENGGIAFVVPTTKINRYVQIIEPPLEKKE